MTTATFGANQIVSVAERNVPKLSVGMKRRTAVISKPGQTSPVQVKRRVVDSKVRAERDSDRELVLQATRGDTDAYRQLVERYQGRAHAVALGVIGNYQDAEDITQEAFVKAYRNLSSFRGQSSFYTWLYRIVFNLAIDLSRKAYRRSEVGVETQEGMDAAARGAKADMYLSSDAGPEQMLRQREIRERFQLALLELSEEHRSVIVLREIEGLSYSEISEVVGCSKGTVMSRLHHARKRLQSALLDLVQEPNEENNEQTPKELGEGKSS